MAFRLNLKIENPCTENWDQMMPDEKGRFCLSCTKQVIDFSKMTDQELIRFFKQNRETEVCGQLSAHQLNHDLTASPRRRWLLPYFLRATLPAMLLINRAEARQTGERDNTAVVSPVNKAADLKHLRLLAPDSAPVVVNGNVVDQEGRPVAYASVKVMGTEQYSLADSAGRFQLHYRGAEPRIQLSCSALSFQDTVAVYNLLEETESCTIRLQPKELLEVVIYSSEAYKRGSLRWGVSWISGADSVTNWLSKIAGKLRLYPNPARTVSTIKVELPAGYEGEVVLRLLSISGQVLQTQKYQAAKGMSALSFPIPRVTPGTYLMQIGSVIKKEWVSEKVLIQ